MLAAVAGLGACATVTDRRDGVMTLNGVTYPTVTQTFETGNGRSYSRTTVRVGVQRVTCKADDVVSCEAAVEQILYRPFFAAP